MNTMAPFTTENATASTVTDLFGVPTAVDVEMWVNQHHPLVPTKDDDFIFRKEQIQLLVKFFTDDEPPKEGLMLTGPYGAGKTSLITNFLARINHPVLTVDWNFESEVADLIGSKGIAFGDTKFEYGALSLAMKYGYVLLINEIDRGRGSNLTEMHDVLEGRPLVIKETGELIEPHPNFRIAVTANSAGQGDLTGQYAGSVRKLDPAFLDRFLYLECTYLDPVEEVDLLMRVHPDFKGVFIERLVNFANETRASATDDTAPLGTAMSTRTLRRFLRYAEAFGFAKLEPNDWGLDNCLPALKPTFLARLSEEEREAVSTMFKMSMGGTA